MQWASCKRRKQLEQEEQAGVLGDPSEWPAEVRDSEDFRFALSWATLRRKGDVVLLLFRWWSRMLRSEDAASRVTRDFLVCDGEVRRLRRDLASATTTIARLQSEIRALQLEAMVAAEQGNNAPELPTQPY